MAAGMMPEAGAAASAASISRAYEKASGAPAAITAPRRKKARRLQGKDEGFIVIPKKNVRRIVHAVVLSVPDCPEKATKINRPRTARRLQRFNWWGERPREPSNRSMRW